ncbi:MAG: helix-turn-helix transcriptional regulator [Actinomadura sp.]
MPIQHIAGSDAHRRAELRDFLRSCRARLSPADVGMPVVGRRRTPGLRREEVAALAGVGVSWYTWLEQGREIKVSESVLEAISDALRLSQAERTHLYLLAGLNPPQPRVESTQSITPQLRQILDGWLPNPAFVLDQYADIKALNDAMAVAFACAEGDNCLALLFTKACRSAAGDSWGDTARSIVGAVRAEAARHPDDPRFEQLAEDLSAVSPQFAELWAGHEVHENFEGYVTINHPDVGELDFEYTLLMLSDRSGLRLGLAGPRRGTMTGVKLGQLLAAHRPGHLTPVKSHTSTAL